MRQKSRDSLPMMRSCRGIFPSSWSRRRSRIPGGGLEWQTNFGGVGSVVCAGLWEGFAGWMTRLGQLEFRPVPTALLHRDVPVERVIKSFQIPSFKSSNQSRKLTTKYFSHSKQELLKYQFAVASNSLTLRTSRKLGSISVHWTTSSRVM